MSSQKESRWKRFCGNNCGVGAVVLFQRLANKMSVRTSEAGLERLVHGARRILVGRADDGKRFGATRAQKCSA